jgi:uncharacterized protein
VNSKDAAKVAASANLYRIVATSALNDGMSHCTLDQSSPVHGLPHWANVWNTGIRLALKTGASLNVVTWFAFTHDCQRRSDYKDPNHGERAADLLIELRNHTDAALRHTLTTTEFDDLEFAVRHHSKGLTQKNATVETCWDADRLDLPRVGIIPNPSVLCTDEAKRMVSLLVNRPRALLRTG